MNLPSATVFHTSIFYWLIYGIALSFASCRIINSKKNHTFKGTRSRNCMYSNRQQEITLTYLALKICSSCADTHLSNCFFNFPLCIHIKWVSIHQVLQNHTLFQCFWAASQGKPKWKQDLTYSPLFMFLITSLTFSSYIKSYDQPRLSKQCFTGTFDCKPILECWFWLCKSPEVVLPHLHKKKAADSSNGDPKATTNSCKNHFHWDISPMCMPYFGNFHFEFSINPVTHKFLLLSSLKFNPVLMLPPKKHLQYFSVIT